MMRRLLCLSALLMLLAPLGAVTARDDLDLSFGKRGYRFWPEIAGYVKTLGSCPRADGKSYVLLYISEPGTPRLKILRLQSNGALDSSYGADGSREINLFAFDAQSSAIACRFHTNADLNDDQVMLVARVLPGPALGNVSWDLAEAVLVDLAPGTLNPGFMLGGPAFWDLSYLASGSRFRPRLRIQDVGPDGGSGWLVSGQIMTHEGTEERALMARIGPDGSVHRVAAPSLPHVQLSDFAIARMGSDGWIRSMGVIESNTGNLGPTWALVRVNPDNLSEVYVTRTGMPDGQTFQLFEGRSSGGGVTVLAALQGTPSGALLPRLLAFRDDEAVDLALPTPLPADVPVGPSGHDGSAVATGAAAGRAVIAVNVGMAGAPTSAIYVAMAQITTSPNLGARVESRFGNEGRIQLSLTTGNDACMPGTAPELRLGNVNGWGAATLVTAHRERVCASGENTLAMAVRVNSDMRPIFKDGLESEDIN